MRVKSSILVLACLLCLFSVTSDIAKAQQRIGFLYTNNNPQGANSVSRFAALDDCTLQLLGQTPTGGTGTSGGFFGSSRLATSGNCLFAANQMANNITVFQINPATGDLAAVGQPVATGGVAGNGLALAPSPDGAFLYASSAISGNIARFSIAEDCSLTVQSPAVTLPANSSPLDMRVSPDGNCLAVSFGAPPSRMASFVRDQMTGALTPAMGSPFDSPGPMGSLPAGLYFNSDGSSLYVGRSQVNAMAINVYDVDDQCVLAARTPVVIGGSNSNVVELNPNEDCLLATSQNANAIATFDVDPAGDLSFNSFIPGAPERAFISGIEFDPKGMCAYVTYHTPSSVASYSVDACTLTSVGVTNTGANPGLLEGMVFVPLTAQ